MRYACIFGASCPNVAKGYLDAAFAAGALLAEEEGLMVNESPDDEALESCRALGRTLAAM